MSLTGCIIQMVQFAAKLVDKALDYNRTIRAVGHDRVSVSEHDRVLKLVENLAQMTQRLTSDLQSIDSISSLSKDEKELMDLAVFASVLVMKIVRYFEVSSEKKSLAAPLRRAFKEASKL